VPSTFLLFDNIPCTNGRGSLLAKRCFTILLFGVYNDVSQVCQLATLTPFIAVATILSGVRKSLKRSRIEVPHVNLLNVCV